MPVITLYGNGEKKSRKGSELKFNIANKRFRKKIIKNILTRLYCVKTICITKI